MNKMFAFFRGTMASFKAAKQNGESLESLYINKIVFIEGDENGEGKAVYAHGVYYANVEDALAALGDRIDDLKYFSGIKVGDVTAYAQGHDGVITFSAEDPSTVSVNVDANGVKIGLTDAFKKAVNEDLPASVAAAKKAGEDAAAQALEDAKAHAETLVGEDSAIAGRVGDVESAIEKLNGEATVEGSVKKQVADAIAGVVASAPEDFDTLKEVADWIANDTTGAAKMQTDIATLKAGADVEGSVAHAVAAEAEIARAAEKANADAITALDGKFTDFEAEYAKDEETIAHALVDLDSRLISLEDKNDTIDSALQASDIVEGSANGTISVQGNDVAVHGLGSAAYTEASAYATAAQGAKADAAAPQATTYTKTEVDGLVNGVDDKFAGYYTQAQVDAIVEEMLTWEEIGFDEAEGSDEGYGE